MQATLYRSLRDEIHRRLTEAGWTRAIVGDPDPDRWVLGDFRRWLAEEYEATAFFMRQNFNDRDEHLDVSGCIGVSYVPAQRLRGLLASLDEEDVTFDLGTLQDPPVDMMTLTVGKREEVDRAADVLDRKSTRLNS